MGKFRVGDKVKVKNIEVGTTFHHYSFTPEMSKYIGKEFTIENDCDDGDYMLEGLWCFWAKDWLEPIKIRNKEDNVKKFRVGDKVRVCNVKVGTPSHGVVFIAGMSEYIGKIFTITSERKYGSGIYMLDGVLYGWAEDWLEPVENKENEK